VTSGPPRGKGIGSSNLLDDDTAEGLADLIQQRKHSLQNRAKAYEYYQQLQKICQPRVVSKFVNNPKTDCPNDHNAQHAD
jgi:hypothetical protein